MNSFTEICAVAAPMPTNHIDTDVIYPGRFLSTIKRQGLGHLLFHGLRYDDQGDELPEFILNQQPYRNAGILVTGDNFGCGSSREHAPWALLGFGITCIISTSFADIFSGNCVKNGILCVVLDPATVHLLMSDALNAAELKVNLNTQTITRPNGEVINFSISPETRETLLSGLDEIDQTLRKQHKIEAFEAKRAVELPWL